MPNVFTHIKDQILLTQTHCVTRINQIIAYTPPLNKLRLPIPLIMLYFLYDTVFKKNPMTLIRILNTNQIAHNFFVQLQICVYLLYYNSSLEKCLP